MVSQRTWSTISLSSLAITEDILDKIIIASIMCTKVSSFNYNLTTLLYCSLIYFLEDLLSNSKAYCYASLMVGTNLSSFT